VVATTREDFNEEAIGSCYRFQRKICADERENPSLIETKEVQEFLKNQLRKRYTTVKVVTDITSIICSKKR